MTQGGLLDWGQSLERPSHVEKLGVFSTSLLSFRVNDCSGLCNEASAGTSLAVQWLRLHASTAEGMGSIPGQGTKIPHATWCRHKKKKKNKKPPPKFQKHEVQRASGLVNTWRQGENGALREGLEAPHPFFIPRPVSLSHLGIPGNLVSKMFL